MSAGGAISAGSSTAFCSSELGGIPGGVGCRGFGSGEGLIVTVFSPCSTGASLD